MAPLYLYQMPNSKMSPTTPTETPMMMPKVVEEEEDEDESESSSDGEKNDVGGGNVGKDGVHDQG
ncbi:unnamed protein product [Sphenostylis stenocarpa]|uniref:Uncharacterized protein n=1 Tax=Sphenostylis stenocarpa TaxID=92480 RepID=A0AA86S979_9FABA|nr:unnamed protein product [Sphenostylis stenocarpa]